MSANVHGASECGIALAPCPFCGKRIARFVNCQEMRACATAQACTDGHYLCVVCSFLDGGCGASSGFFPAESEAAEAWNRRTGCIEINTLNKLLDEYSYGQKQP